MSTALCYLHPDCRELPDLGAECLRGQRAAARAWRATWIPTLRTARWLEQQATESGLPFEVRPDWMPPTLDWATFEETVRQFEERVLLVASRFGAPVEVRHSDHAFGNNGPDLVAAWHIPPPAWEKRKHLVLQVRALTPADIRQNTRRKPHEYVREGVAIRKTDAAALARIAKRAGLTMLSNTVDAKEKTP